MEKQEDKRMCPTDGEIINWMEKWMPDVECKDMGDHMNIEVGYYELPIPSAYRKVSSGTVRAAIRKAMIETGDFSLHENEVVDGSATD